MSFCKFFKSSQSHIYISDLSGIVNYLTITDINSVMCICHSSHSCTTSI